MKLDPFKLERYFVPYEFSVKYLLCSSDCDGLSQKELVGWADAETKDLWDNLKLSYTESQGHPLLRAEIAKLYSGIDKDQILGVVPEEGIFIAMNTLLSKGDHVICMAPGYQSLSEIAEKIGCEVTFWLPEEEAGWRFNPDFLSMALEPNTKLVIINFPHNPTGFLPSKEDLQKIIEFVKQHDLYLFSDEMYRFLEYQPEDHLPSGCEVYPKAVCLFGMSKTFGMAGARIGWLATQDKKLLEDLKTYKDYTTICSSASSEVLSIIALRNKEKIISNHLTRINRNLTLLDQFFLKYSRLFSWNRPKAGTIGFPKILSGESAFSFCDKLVKEAGIMLLPSTVYDYDDHHFRIGFGRENMPEALAKLEEYLEISL